MPAIPLPVGQKPPLPTLPRCFAHRGGGRLAPENTLAGIRLAARLGVRAVEFDVMLSGEGTPLLIHDETLERTTNGRGRVAETPDRILFSLDAGGEPLPRFVDAARLCRELGLLANIEIKPAAGVEIETGRVVAALADSLWRDAPKPLLSSFSPLALEAARDVAPALPCGWLVDCPPDDWPRQLARLEAQTLHCALAGVSREVLSKARILGVPLLVYTVNDEKVAKRLFAAGVSAVFTDCPDLVGRF
ncbi:MAG: glycerophosphodiester phosphodiesterase [Azonexus sp.]|nr:glycerophosphodiester phosphodiesterase [Azonexus sp.]MCK6411219.1 glycerophosphodiester phosphodiesterase [Azonexus sp.]